MYPSIKTPTLKIIILGLALLTIGLSGSIQAGDEGCVTCHVGPMALNELLAKNEAHPDVSAMVNTILAASPIVASPRGARGGIAPRGAEETASSRLAAKEGISLRSSRDIVVTL